MTFQELYKALKTLALPVAYNHFDHPPSIPFLVFLDEGKDRFIADASIWTSMTRIRLELYFENGEEFPALDEKIEVLLSGLGILYEDAETYYIPDEGLYQHNYYFKI